MLVGAPPSRTPTGAIPVGTDRMAMDNRQEVIARGYTDFSSFLANNKDQHVNSEVEMSTKS